MTDVKIIHNPFDNTTTLVYGSHVIRSSGNKINSYIISDGFYSILLPFRKRYSVWNGLLAELIYEVNDDELNIVFEGRHSDFELVKKSFEECRDIVENSGYSNLWSLSYKENFEAVNLKEQILYAADMLKESCETRAELKEIDEFKETIDSESVDSGYARLNEILKKHKEKWEGANYAFKMNRISELELIMNNLQETGSKIKQLKKEGGSI